MSRAPLSRTELLALPPVISLVTLGQALGLSEPVIRERARRDELTPLGIRVLRLGAKYVIPTSDVLRFLGVEADMQMADPASTEPATDLADARRADRRTTDADCRH